MLPSPREFGYRRRIKLRAEGGAVGFYAAASHALVPIEHCLLARTEPSTPRSPRRMQLVCALAAPRAPHRAARDARPAGDRVVLAGEVEGAVGSTRRGRAAAAGWRRIRRCGVWCCTGAAGSGSGATCRSGSTPEADLALHRARAGVYAGEPGDQPAAGRDRAGLGRPAAGPAGARPLCRRGQPDPAAAAPRCSGRRGRAEPPRRRRRRRQRRRVPGRCRCGSSASAPSAPSSDSPPQGVRFDAGGARPAAQRRRRLYPGAPAPGAAAVWSTSPAIRRRWRAISACCATATGSRPCSRSTCSRTRTTSKPWSAPRCLARHQTPGVSSAPRHESVGPGRRLPHARAHVTMHTQRAEV